jgi:RNA polymerase sigma-70 factor (ECF subfamily)
MAARAGRLDNRMSHFESTCWTVIQAAAAGDAAERTRFAHRYERVIRAYLTARWRGSSLRGQIEDALQEVFVECFKHGGVLDRADRGRAGGFRPFFYGVVRNVARRFEAGRVRPPAQTDLDSLVADDDSLSRVFDRAWAKALMREAAERQAERARLAGADALKRVDLLRLRFHDELPIRDVAARWNVDAAQLHHEYAKARREFKDALLEVMAFHHPGPPTEVEQACAELLTILE